LKKKVYKFNMDFLKKGINKIKDIVSQVDLEKKLAEATTNERGFVSLSLLNEIASIELMIQRNVK